MIAYISISLEIPRPAQSEKFPSPGSLKHLGHFSCSVRFAGTSDRRSYTLRPYVQPQFVFIVFVGTSWYNQATCHFWLLSLMMNLGIAASSTMASWVWSCSSTSSCLLTVMRRFSNCLKVLSLSFIRSFVFSVTSCSPFTRLPCTPS